MEQRNVTCRIHYRRVKFISGTYQNFESMVRDVLQKRQSINSTVLDVVENTWRIQERDTAFPGPVNLACAVYLPRGSAAAVNTKAAGSSQPFSSISPPKDKDFSRASFFCSIRKNDILTLCRNSHLAQARRYIRELAREVLSPEINFMLETPITKNAHERLQNSSVHKIQLDLSMAAQTLNLNQESVGGWQKMLVDHVRAIVSKRTGEDDWVGYDQMKIKTELSANYGRGLRMRPLTQKMGVIADHVIDDDDCIDFTIVTKEGKKVKRDEVSYWHDERFIEEKGNVLTRDIWNAMRAYYEDLAQEDVLGY